MLKGNGHSKPKIIFVADGGGVPDVASGNLISGYARKSILDVLKSKNIDTEQIYYTALIKEKILTHSAKEEVCEKNRQKITTQYQSILLEEISGLNPFLIIPMGELSFNYLTGLKGISKYRGSVLQTQSTLSLSKRYKVLPILGPQPYWNQSYQNKLISEIDFDKVPKQLHDGPPTEESYNIWVCRSAAALQRFLDRRYGDDKILYFDIETYGTIPTCISLCFGDGESVCVPFMDLTIDGRERAAMLSLVIKVLASKCPKVNQNIKYDEGRLETFGFRVNNITGDTTLGLSCIYPEFAKNLGFQTSIYTDMPYFKDEGKQYDPNGNSKDRLYLYNAKDSVAVSIIYPQQLEEMKHFNTIGVYEKLVKLMPVYKIMERTGLKIDNEARLSLLSKYETLSTIEEYKLNRMAGYKVNSESDQQVNQLVYEDLGYVKVPGVKATDEKSLHLLMAYSEAKRAGRKLANDILQSILDNRKLHKVLQFIQGRFHPDGRMRTSYNLSGTENGRTSGGETSDTLLFFNPKKGNKIDEKYIGHSFQTIGKHGFQIDGIHYGVDLRSMFVADNGYTFVGFDLSSAEARVDTILANDLDILPIFDNGTGIHRLTGSWVYDCEPSDIKKNVLVNGEERYHVAKQVRHAAERNMREHMCMILTGLPAERCKVILKKVHAAQPNIKGVFHHSIREIVHKERRLIAPNNRHRIFTAKMDSHLENEAISFLPQAIVSDQTKFSLLPICERYPPPQAFPLVEAHDGVLFMVKDRLVEEFIATCKPMVETPIDFRNGSLKRDYLLTIPTEWETGKSWYGLEDYKI